MAEDKRLQRKNKLDKGILQKSLTNVTDGGEGLAVWSTQTKCDVNVRFQGHGLGFKRNIWG